jgi:hypothetical protein
MWKRWVNKHRDDDGKNYTQRIEDSRNQIEEFEKKHPDPKAEQYFLPPKKKQSRDDEDD